MVQPKCYENNSHNDIVCKLKKAIYALKQAQQVLNERFDTFFLGLGFRICWTNPNIYSLKLQELSNVSFSGQATYGGTIKPSKEISLSIILKASTHLAGSSISFITVSHAHDWNNSLTTSLLH